MDSRLKLKPHYEREIVELQEHDVPVVIRMKKMGKSHRAFFRICATDKRAPRDGRVLEELGTYDPSVPETDARAKLNRSASTTGSASAPSPARRSRY